ncbi:unnamed protein product [Rhodiola kirilowii]
MPKALALIQPKEEPFADCSTNFAQSTIPSPNSTRLIDSSLQMVIVWHTIIWRLEDYTAFSIS